MKTFFWLLVFMVCVGGFIWFEMTPHAPQIPWLGIRMDAAIRQASWLMFGVGAIAGMAFIKLMTAGSGQQVKSLNEQALFAKRQSESARVQTDIQSDRVKALENKIETLEKALSKALGSRG